VRLRIATLNVWGLPPLAPDIPERMHAIGRRLAELALDVMAFQEVWTADAREILVREGRAAGLPHAWHTDAEYGGSGLLLLSRHPILEVRFARFLLRGQPERITQGDYYGGKGFGRVRLETDVGPVTLVNTHLHARYGGDVAHEYRAIRAAQVVELAMGMSDATDPVLALGDFNFEESDSGYRVLTGLTGFRDTAAEIGMRQPTVIRHNAYRSGPHKAERRIDFAFARDGRELGVRTRAVRRAFDDDIEIAGHRASYSDHAGIIAEVELAACAAGSPHRPDRGALELAAQLLAEGRDEARGRQQDRRALAGAGLGGALLALGALRTEPITRRKLLRKLARVAGVAAIAPAVGYSILSEYFVPGELAGFDTIAQRLAEFERQRGAAKVA
jgi:endonuclease/exonuclease/phosphatase family metal-dependent hydrolase